VTKRNAKFGFDKQVQPDSSELAAKLEYAPPKPVPVKKLEPKVRNNLATTRPEVAKPKTLSL